MVNLEKAISEDVSTIFNIDENLILENMNESLFHEPYFLTSEQLVFLYFYIKKKYKIDFLYEDIVDYSFLSIEKICATIRKCI